ncbi:MAG: EamA family transporter [Synergistaceae bacterium]|jgi:drug/metabolite transporter (DMT)-like permease|nr:EamA family transporter [Synergistaceae bacterium]
MNTSKKSERPKLILTALCFLAVYFIWGSTYLGISISIKTAPIFVASGVRFLCAGALLMVCALLTGVSPPTRPNISVAVKSGLLAFFVSYGLISWAEKILPSSTTALLVSLEPAMLVAFDWLFFNGPKPGRRIVSYQLLGVVGVAVLIVGERTSPANGVRLTEYALALAAVIFSGFSWIYGALLASKSGDSHSNTAMASGLQMFCGGIFFAVAAVFTGGFGHMGEISRESWLAILYLITFGSIIAYSSYMLLLRTQPASKVSTHAFVNPIVAVALGWAIADETVTVFTAVSTALIVLSTAGIIRERGA